MTKRKDYSIKQEFIVNGLLVTLNEKERVYFDRIEAFEEFYNFWVENSDLSTKECLRLAEAKMLKDISLKP